MSCTRPRNDPCAEGAQAEYDRQRHGDAQRAEVLLPEVLGHHKPMSINSVCASKQPTR